MSDAFSMTELVGGARVGEVVEVIRTDAHASYYCEQQPCGCYTRRGDANTILLIVGWNGCRTHALGAYLDYLAARFAASPQSVEYWADDQCPYTVWLKVDGKKIRLRRDKAPAVVEEYRALMYQPLKAK